jgi:hypothetical protein
MIREGGSMLKRTSLLAAVLLVAVPASVLALKTGEREVKLPASTKIVKQGDVTRFILPDGVLELTGLKGELLVKAFDSQGKLLYTAKQAKIFSGKGKRREIPILKLRDKTAIDDDITWVKFSPEPAGR